MDGNPANPDRVSQLSHLPKLSARANHAGMNQGETANPLSFANQIGTGSSYQPSSQGGNPSLLDRIWALRRLYQDDAHTDHRQAGGNNSTNPSPAQRDTSSFAASPVSHDLTWGGPSMNSIGFNIPNIQSGSQPSNILTSPATSTTWSATSNTFVAPQATQASLHTNTMHFSQHLPLIIGPASWLRHLGIYDTLGCLQVAMNTPPNQNRPSRSNYNHVRLGQHYQSTSGHVQNTHNSSNIIGINNGVASGPFSSNTTNATNVANFTNADQSFTLFLDLPAELQLYTWGLAIDDAKPEQMALIFHWYEGDYELTNKFTSSITHTPFLSTYVDARKGVLRKYPDAEACPYSKRRILLDPEQDEVFLFNNSEGHNTRHIVNNISYVLHQPVFTKIKNLVLRGQNVDPAKSLVPLLTKFQALENLTVTVTILRMSVPLDERPVNGFVLEELAKYDTCYTMSYEQQYQSLRQQILSDIQLAFHGRVVAGGTLPKLCPKVMTPGLNIRDKKRMEKKLRYGQH
ncbi:hypothetical protein B0J14DRAFT_638998 [Halenospora varia]|nr:hypothetical protein B0J14DRAFT_638998 [Halenospora varia]